MAEFEERDLLAIAQILRSKKRAASLLKIMRGLPIEKVVEAAKEMAKELKEKRQQSYAATLPEASAEQKELLFILRNLALMGLPHKPTDEPRIQRLIRTSPSSWITITLSARSHAEGVLLPFGINARRVLTMLCTLAVKTKNPVITLDSAAEFMRRIGWKPDGRGGMGGNRYDMIAQTLEQLQKCSIDVELHGMANGRRKQADSLAIIRKYDLPSSTDEKLINQGAEPLPLDPGIVRSFKVLIDPLFFRELVGDPTTGYKGSAFPLPLDFVKQFRRSTELDVAQFLVARVSAAQSPSKIDLHSIHEQLAFHPDNYSKFKKEFTDTVAKVKELWEGCNANVEGHKLVVGPVLNGKFLVDPTKFDNLPEDLFGLNTPTLASRSYEEPDVEKIV